MSATSDNSVYLTVDIVVIVPIQERWHVLLIRRGHEPFAGRWALPGGYVDPGETSRQAAARELAEETGVTIPEDALRQIGAYDDPDRDPRGRVVAVAYLVEPASAPDATAGDDAAAAAWVPLDVAMFEDLAFDHGRILADAARMASYAAARRGGVR